MCRFLFFLLIVLAIVGGFLGVSFYQDAFLSDPDPEAEATSVYVEPGESVKAVAKKLEEQGVVTSDWLFELYVRLMDAGNSLQAGEFAVQPGTSFQELVKQLSDAQAEEGQVTIPEGYTVDQIGDVLTKEMGIASSDWQAAASAEGKLEIESKDVVQTIPKGQGLEGYLFPDTYRFHVDADAQTVAQKMVQTLGIRLLEDEIAIPEEGTFDDGRTLHEVITLASIIEREVQHPEDMKHVAGIFMNRLQIGMALQADSTVNYVTGKKTPGISLEDTKLDSPYNTYKVVGLPPGPISNPGMHAIRAALNPMETDDLYFLTDAEGTVYYAQTFSGHQQNRAQHLD